MALAEVTDTALGLKDMSKGEVIEGYYDGARNVTTKHGDRLIHSFTTRDGDVVTVWGSALLDRRLKSVRPHLFTRITYRGTIKSSNGSEMHEVLVEADKDDADPAIAKTDEIPF